MRTLLKCSFDVEQTTEKKISIVNHLLPWRKYITRICKLNCVVAKVPVTNGVGSKP